MKPIDFDELYPGRFFKAGLLEGKPTYVISDVDMEELEGETGPKMKGILSFRGEKRQLPLNKTNGICIREMFGRALPDWIGKGITLFAGEHSGEPAVRIWGSPDIEKDMKVVVALPRKKPFTMTMHATGARPPAAIPKQSKPQRSEAARVQLQAMAAASDMDALSLIADALAEDGNLSAEDTQFLTEQLKRRKAQLEGAAK